ncbi:MAG: hypothetical protein CTY18_06070 [Methylomonas sp.]|nr:MAG: hypothetical protein CTY24_11780 [Methylobacter sp.]PPD36040.1 MAG: hypothetical protein CTY18_06070 [Methylomonas sp.]
MTSEDWLKKAVSRGLQGLIVLHLEGAPSAETVVKTAGVWVHVMRSWPIEWIEELDRPRLRTAFTVLAGQCRRWPAPTDLRTHLPARVYPEALPAPAYPADKAKANLQKIRDLMAEKLTGMTAGNRGNKP